MAYATTNPPLLVRTGLAGTGQEWDYKSTDANTVVRVDGYITNAQLLGMLVGDKINVHDTDAVPYTVTEHIVSVINADGSANLSDAGATYSANTD